MRASICPTEAINWSLIWVAVSFVFVGWLWWYLGGTAGDPVADQKALEFVTGYLVEKALAVDNIFVFLMLFTYFAVPAEYHGIARTEPSLGTQHLAGVTDKHADGETRQGCEMRFHW